MTSSMICDSNIRRSARASVIVVAMLHSAGDQQSHSSAATFIIICTLIHLNASCPRWCYAPGPPHHIMSVTTDYFSSILLTCQTACPPYDAGQGDVTLVSMLDPARDRRSYSLTARFVIRTAIVHLSAFCCRWCVTPGPPTI
jgi:hypothetical protein